MAIRRRVAYSGDAYPPQEDLSRYLRIGWVESINTEKGVCTLRWLDNPGGRINVGLTQSTWGEYCMPIAGAIVLVMFDKHDQAKIVRYANLNQHFDQKSRAEGGESLIPKIKAGEKFWYSVGGAYVYLTETGRVLFSDQIGNMLEIDPDTLLMKMTTVNWSVISQAGSIFSGDVKRYNTTGTLTPIKSGGQQLEECTVKINDFNPTIVTSGVTTVKVNIGNYVDNTGNVLDKDSLPVAAMAPTALAVRLEVDAPAGTTVITIDKMGTVQVQSSKVVIKSDDILFGDEFATEQGTLGTTLKDILNTLKNTFNSHVHSGVTTGGGSSAVATTTLSYNADSVLSSKVKLK